MKMRWLAWFVWVLGLLVGCPGGGGGSLAVELTSPDDGQTEVPVEALIGARFDAPLDPDSLTTESFRLTDAAGTVIPGTAAIGAEPDRAVFTPRESLSVITTFTATLTTELRATGGQTLQEDFQWSFRTLDSAWGASENIENIGTGSASNQEIAVDAQSNAVAVWEHFDGFETNIWANRYTRRDLWGAPELIETNDAEATRPRLAVDPSGNAFAVWEQSDGTDTFIWANRYAIDEGWGSAELIQTDEITRARWPSVAADPAGNAIAVWIQRDIETREDVVWSNRYVPGQGWGSAELIDPIVAPLADNATEVGMDADGNAIAVWARPTFAGNVIWANRYTRGSGWGTAELIKPDEATAAGVKRLAVSPSGSAFVAWVQPEDTRQDVWSVRFSGSSWGTPERIDNYDAGDTKEPDIGVDRMGVAFAVWSQSDEAFDNIWANRYTTGSGWGTPELIEEANPDPTEDANAARPRIAINADGNAFVVWQQEWENWLSIWSNRYDPDTGWFSAELIEQITRAGKSPKIAADENRHAHALWLHSTEELTDTVRTNRFE